MSRDSGEMGVSRGGTAISGGPVGHNKGKLAISSAPEQAQPFSAPNLPSSAS